MLAKVLRVHWHDKQPVFSVDFDPNDSEHFVTAGGDNNVRVRVSAWGIVKLLDMATEEGPARCYWCSTGAGGRILCHP